MKGPRSITPELAAFYERALRPSKQARKRQRMDALNNGEHVTPYAAGLIESGRAPIHGFQSVHRYVEWFSDGDDSRYTA